MAEDSLLFGSMGDVQSNENTQPTKINTNYFINHWAMIVVDIEKDTIQKIDWR